MISINQRAYIEAMVKKFNLTNTKPVLTLSLHPASKWDNLTTTLLLPIYNFKALCTTPSPLMEVTTGCHNVIVASSTDTLNRIATHHYNHFYSVKSASGSVPLKTTALISTCLWSPSKPSEATSPTTKTLKIQTTQIIVYKPQ